MEHRIFGLESEFGVTFSYRGQRRLSPDEVARHLFRRVVHWGRSSNVFLENGSRLYLDVGSHPEYATAECDDLEDLVAQDKAGEWILSGLVQGAQAAAPRGRHQRRGLPLQEQHRLGRQLLRLPRELPLGARRRARPPQRGDDPVPRLAPDLLGAGKVLHTAKGPTYCVSQRAEHIWESVSSATTRSRPIINTRDEPHADAERYRRLHVIVGRHEHVRVRHLPEGGCDLPHARDGRGRLDGAAGPHAWRTRSGRSGRSPRTRRASGRSRLANGREISALEIQSEYLDRAMRFARPSRPAARPQAGARDVAALRDRPRRRPDVARPRGRLGDEA